MVGLDRVRNSGEGSLELSLGLLLDLSLLGLGDSLLWGVVGLSVLSKYGSIRVELVHKGFVLQWVLLGSSGSLWLRLGCIQGNLDFIGVDDLGDIGVGDDGVFQVVVSSSSGFTGESTELFVQSLFRVKKV